MMVARDGVEPPTPAFSESYLLIVLNLAQGTCPILPSLLEPKWSQAVQI
jgi:hypothetical protein